MTFSLSVLLTPCQVPVEMQADPSVTSVCWARREASEKRKQTLRRPNLDPLHPVASQKRQQLWKKKLSVLDGRAKEILDLKHGCFVFTWTRRLLQTDGEWKYLIMRGRFPSYFGSAAFAWGTKRRLGFLRSIYKGTTHLKIALQSDWLTVNVLVCPKLISMLCQYWLKTVFKQSYY